MESLIHNLMRPTVRKAMLNGRPHYVVPMSLIVNGVLPGSEGAIFYPLDEMEYSVDSWNGMPLVLNHPQDDEGNWISASSEGIYEKQGLGEVRDARMVRNRLIANGWFDIAKTREVNPSLLQKILSGRPIELSTGLFVEQEYAPLGSNHEGRSYSRIARDFEPDHVAILPNNQGACSVKDGCGANVVVNRKKKPQPVTNKPGGKMATREQKKKKLIDGLILNCKCSKGNPAFSEADRPALDLMSDKGLIALSQTHKPAPVVNVEPEEDEDEDDLDVAPKGKDKKKVPVANTPVEEPKKPITDKEWLEQAPPGVRTAVMNSLKIERKEKLVLVNRLVGHIEDDDAREALAKKLMAKDLEDLEERVSMMPVATKRGQVNNRQEEEDELTQFFTSEEPITRPRTEAKKDKYEDSGPVLTVNYNEMASPGLVKHLQTRTTATAK